MLWSWPKNGKLTDVAEGLNAEQGGGLGELRLANRLQRIGGQSSVAAHWQRVRSTSKRGGTYDRGVRRRWCSEAPTQRLNSGHWCSSKVAARRAAATCRGTYRTVLLNKAVRGRCSGGSSASPRGEQFLLAWNEHAWRARAVWQNRYNRRMRRSDASASARLWRVLHPNGRVQIVTSTSGTRAPEDAKIELQDGRRFQVNVWEGGAQ